MLQYYRYCIAEFTGTAPKAELKSLGLAMPVIAETERLQTAVVYWYLLMVNILSQSAGR